MFSETRGRFHLGSVRLDIRKRNIRPLMWNKTTKPSSPRRRGGRAAIPFESWGVFVFLQWEHNWPRNGNKIFLICAAWQQEQKKAQKHACLYGQDGLLCIVAFARHCSTEHSQCLSFIHSSHFTNMNIWVMCSSGQMPVRHFTSSLNQGNLVSQCIARMKLWHKGVRKALWGCVLRPCFATFEYCVCEHKTTQQLLHPVTRWNGFVYGLFCPSTSFVENINARRNLFLVVYTHP